MNNKIHFGFRFSFLKKKLIRRERLVLVVKKKYDVSSFHFKYDFEDDIFN